MAHVIKTMQDTLPADPWHGHYRVPAWLAGADRQGRAGPEDACRHLPQGRSGDPGARSRPAGLSPTAPADVDAGRPGDPQEAQSSRVRFAQLRASEQPQAQFLWAIFRDIFHYTPFHLADIADNARDLDFAMRWGFGWAQGPFETWQAAGWRADRRGSAGDIDSGKAMSQAPLPAWVFRVADGRARAAGVLLGECRRLSVRVRRCRSISGRFFPSASWARKRRSGKRSGRTTGCVCGRCRRSTPGSPSSASSRGTTRSDAT
jgi:3-hydroxyacyl-CoA dehydrogenase